jgi:hypothetical protein
MGGKKMKYFSDCKGCAHFKMCRQHKLVVLFHNEGLCEHKITGREYRIMLKEMKKNRTLLQLQMKREARK